MTESDKRRLAGIEDELAETIGTTRVSYSWDTVEFLLLQVRDHEALLDTAVRHATAAYESLRHAQVGNPGVQDAQRLLSDVIDRPALERAKSETSRIMTYERMRAYRAGRESRENEIEALRSAALRGETGAAYEAGRLAVLEQVRAFAEEKARER